MSEKGNDRIRQGSGAAGHIRILALAACILILSTSRSFADITLVSRYSDARAEAHGNGQDNVPPPQIQTNFLPATLSNSASIIAAKGGTGASASLGSNSTITVNNSAGTLRVTAGGNINMFCLVPGANAQASAKYIVLSFTLTDQSYFYSISGVLPGGGGLTSKAKLTSGASTIFEVNSPPPVSLTNNGMLPPGTYTISIEFSAFVQSSGNPVFINTFPNFNFALDPTVTPTPCPACTPTPTPSPTPTPTPSPTPPPTPTPSPTPSPTPTSTPPPPGPCSFRVLLVDAEAGMTGLQTALLAEPGIAAADIFDASADTPSLALLQQYDIVVAASGFFFADSTLIGNNLADYVDAGGIVVQLAFSFIGPGEGYSIDGRWLTGGYSPYVYNLTTASGLRTLGAFNFNHPLMQGVSQLQTDAWQPLSLASGATQVAAWTFGDSLIATKPVGTHTTVGVTAFVSDFGTWSGHFPRVIANAGRWLGAGGCPTPTPTPPPCGTFGSSGDIRTPVGPPAPASPYPSNIVVSGLGGSITHVTVRLRGLYHAFPDNLDILLVGPGGQNAVIMSDVGGDPDAINLFITLDDAAATALPDAGPLVSGSFRPNDVNDGTDIYYGPAPVPSGSSALSVFNGTNPNGTWSLYMVNDTAISTIGNITSGWEITISTTNCSGVTPTPTPTATPTPINATHFSVVAPSTVIDNIPFNFTVTALDQFNNTVTNYGGTIHFTSTDNLAVLPANSTLTNGTGTFSARLRQIFTSQTITATDTLNSSITGTSNNIFVNKQQPPTPTPMPLSISGSTFYCPNPIPGPVPGVTLTRTGASGGSTLSDASGNYTLSSIPWGGSYIVTPTKAARTSGSPGINTVDVVAIQRHFLSLGTPLSGCRLTAADVNGTTTVDTVDVIAVQRFFLGLSTGLANTGKYQFNPASRSYPGLNSNQTAQNYDTLIFGDVAAPFTE